MLLSRNPVSVARARPLLRPLAFAALSTTLAVSVPMAAVGGTPRTQAVAIDGATATSPASPKARLVVLSDIEAESDDSQSLVRLLLYANEIDLVGLVATTSTHLRGSVHPDSIRHIVKTYGEVQPNLAMHAKGYPSASVLLGRVSQGLPVFGMAGVGKGMSSPGSRLIVEALKSSDPRPLWVSVWGGANTLAQALFDIRETATPEEVKRLAAKLRVYTISDQDDSGAWIRRTFPDLFYIVSPGSYGVATWGGMSQTVDGIDNSAVSNGWIARNIQQGRGPLGAAYPDVTYSMEGDTPSFLSLIPNGLNMPDRPDWGGWGGRYILRTPDISELDRNGFTGNVPVDAETRPIWTNAVDTVTPFFAADFGRSVQRGKKSFTDFRATIWRWRDAVQNDFAARINWTTAAYAQANHAPVPKLNHADSIRLKGGATFVFDAGGSSDPDGDSLSYLWLDYPEAGTYGKPAALSGPENYYRTVFTAPKVDREVTIHFILAVSDKRDLSLTRYKRVVITVVP